MSDNDLLTKLEEIQRLLQRQLRGRVRNVRVIHREGHVALQGIATNYHAKQLAQHLVLNTLDSVILVNEIDVPHSISEPRAGSLAFG